MNKQNYIDKIGSLIKDNLLFLIIVLANLIVRTYHLASESLYGDEPYSIFYGQQKFGEVLPYLLKDQNPPLHLTLLHFWMNIFGITDVSAKMFSVTCTVLASGVLFLFAKKFINKTTAILVSLLFLFSNSQQFFATEVRPYAMVQLLCIVSFYVYFSLLNKPKLKYLIFLFLINLTLLFAHYLTLFIFVVQFIGIIFYLKRKQKGSNLLFHKSSVGNLGYCSLVKSSIL